MIAHGNPLLHLREVEWRVEQSQADDHRYRFARLTGRRAPCRQMETLAGCWRWVCGFGVVLATQHLKPAAQRKVTEIDCNPSSFQVECGHGSRRNIAALSVLFIVLYCRSAEIVFFHRDSVCQSVSSAERTFFSLAFHRSTTAQHPSRSNRREENDNIDIRVVDLEAMSGQPCPASRM